MSIPYRTRRRLNRLGIVLMILLLVGTIAWLCWVVWLERYVVYTADGASLDFEQSAQDISGEVAAPPVAQQNISIYYNEGSDALDTGNELTQINGYFISSNMLQNDINLETFVLHDLFELCVYIERAAGNAARAAADEYLLGLTGKALFAHFTERTEFLS